MNPATVDSRNLPAMSSSLDVFLLGTVDLASSIELQERLRVEVAGRADSHGAVLVCEHPPSVTIGREGSFADVLVEREELVARQMEVRWLNRGGGAFVHLPGQLAVYVIVPLDRLKLGMLAYRTALETSLIATAADLKVPAERAIAAPGVVCRCGQFAFIGGAVRDWVSHGGMHVNVSLPQEALDLVRWTDSDVRVTSLAAQRTRPTAMSTVRESLTRNLAASLGYGSYHLYTGHPLLHRSTRKVYVYA
jgi:lipoyl(octanoyl) transferase